MYRRDRSANWAIKRINLDVTDALELVGQICSLRIGSSINPLCITLYKILNIRLNAQC